MTQNGDFGSSMSAMLGVSLQHAQAMSDEMRGRLGHMKPASSNGGGASLGLSRKLDSRLGLARRFGHRNTFAAAAASFDQRQRAIVKVHYFGHGGGGSAALIKHAGYIGRDAADEPNHEPTQHGENEQRKEAHDQALALEPKDAPGTSPFYTASNEGVDGAAKARAWAASDRRHFRLIVSAEKGADLGDLKPYAREVMARAETTLGVKLEWVAANHRDTDNPHTHVILRGRTANGRLLTLPQDFIKHGLRNIARDVATERFGERARTDARRALEREARAHRPTRLDAMFAAQIGPDGLLKISAIKAPAHAPELTGALKTRAKELARLGLADEVKRNVLKFKPDWQAHLKAMELHLDIRKALLRDRQGPSQKSPQRGPRR